MLDQAVNLVYTIFVALCSSPLEILLLCIYWDYRKWLLVISLLYFLDYELQPSKFSQVTCHHLLSMFVTVFQFVASLYLSAIIAASLSCGGDHDTIFDFPPCISCTVVKQIQ